MSLVKSSLGPSSYEYRRLPTRNPEEKAREKAEDAPLGCLDSDMGGECCFSWSVDLAVWRTHHPDWGVTRSKRGAYCLSKFEGKKADFRRVEE